MSEFIAVKLMSTDSQWTNNSSDVHLIDRFHNLSFLFYKDHRNVFNSFDPNKIYKSCLQYQSLISVNFFNFLASSHLKSWGMGSMDKYTNALSSLTITMHSTSVFTIQTLLSSVLPWFSPQFPSINVSFQDVGAEFLSSDDMVIINCLSVLISFRNNSFALWPIQ